MATASVILGTTAALAPANATLAGFNAGNIMSDAVMGAANTMSVAQIQAFLDGKNACNKAVSSGNDSGVAVVVTSASSAYLSTNSAVTYQITGGVPGTKNGTFLCLRNSTLDGQSAAQTIYDVSQQYQINPQVLIVLLRKEESLITDKAPSSSQYKIATGFGCPDTAACNTDYYGFKNQLSHAANLFRTVLNGGWSNYPAYTTMYVQYNPTASCGGSNVFISNYATSALYRYTPYQPNAAVLANPPGTVVACGAYGNSNFYSFFTDWFGSTQTPTPMLPSACDSRVSGVGCVWRIQNPTNGAQLLTSSLTEVTSAVRNLGWMYIGQAFYAFTTQATGTVPVYRVNNGGQYVFTADPTQSNDLIAAGATPEGVAFFAYPPTTTTNASYQVYQFTNSANQATVAQSGTTDAAKVAQLGFTQASALFNVTSGLAPTPLPPNGQANVYRLNGNEHFWTTSLLERDNLLSSGWANEGVAFTASANATTTPTYRLYNGGTHFWTTNASEKASLVSAGWTLEGIAWYADADTPTTYRFRSTDGTEHMYTANLTEAIMITNRGWQYEGIAFGQQQGNSSTTPVYRLNGGSAGHLYTTNTTELLTVANNNWTYEGVSWQSTQAGDQVFRLLNPISGEHLWTTDSSEEQHLLADGWSNEGILSGGNSPGSTTPIYRLYDPHSNLHFWTSSPTERDGLQMAGWRYEGIAWLAP